jgi:ABC-type transporter Mla subunit MlaD
MSTKQKATGRAQSLNATIQWVALFGVFALFVIAIFVFNIAGAGGGGGGGGTRTN